MIATLHYESISKNYYQLKNSRITFLILLFFTFSQSVSAQSKKKQIEELQKQIDSLETVISTQKSQISDLDFNLKKTTLENEQNQKSVSDYQQKLKTAISDLDEQNKNYQKTINNLQQTLAIRENLNNRLDKENDSLKNEITSLEVLITNLSKSDENDMIYDESGGVSDFQILQANSPSDDVTFKIKNFITNREKALASPTGEGASAAIEFCNAHYVSWFIGGNIYYGGAHPEDIAEYYFFRLTDGEMINFSDLISPSNQLKIVELFNQKFNQEIEERSKTGMCMDNTSTGEIPLSPFENIEGIIPENEGISLGYSDWSYADRVCDITIQLTWEEIRPYVPATFYEYISS